MPSKNCLSLLAYLTDGKVCDKNFLVKNDLFPANKEGFAVLYDSDYSVDINALLALAKTKIVTDISKKCFIAGSFDGRSSLDRSTETLRHIVIDCEYNDFATFLKELIESLGIEVSPLNFARERLGGGKPRKTQFRIPGREASKFMSIVGLVSQ